MVKWSLSQTKLVILCLYALIAIIISLRFHILWLHKVELYLIIIVSEHVHNVINLYYH